MDIAKEYYLAILMDRATGGPVVIASTEGGVDIESVAEHTPEKISRELVDPAMGLQHYQARKIAQGLGFGGALNKPAAEVIFNLFKLFSACDCSMVEVNPLVLTPDNKVLALDAKFNFDDNALYRHKDIVAMRDVAEEDPREVEASKFGLNYIGLDATSPAWSTARGWRWRRWISSSITAATRRTSWTWAAARRSLR